MMIGSNIMGRLGNQMFQIAATEALAIRNKDFAVFPTAVIGACPTHYERALYSSTILSRIKYMTTFEWVKKKYDEPDFSYNELSYQDGLFLQGYFQSEKYFSDVKSHIKNLFAPTEWVESQLQYYYGNFYINPDPNRVAVHVRRGDYVKLADVHSNLAQNHNYYDFAMQQFKGKKFVFFSDDIKWCREHFGEEHLYIHSVNDVLDLYLMSKIKNKIIANSSFSWWAAWLGEEEDSKIIAPKNWFENDTPTFDLIPDRWERV